MQTLNLKGMKEYVSGYNQGYFDAYMDLEVRILDWRQRKFSKKELLELLHATYQKKVKKANNENNNHNIQAS